MKTGIFRDELPGEKKSIINLLLTGWLVVVSILGYVAFYLSIQFSQVDRILASMDHAVLSTEQFNTIKDQLMRTTQRLHTEVIWISILGGFFSIIGGFYTYSMVVRPLRKLVAYAEEGKEDLPEINQNNEIKQLMTLITEKMPPESTAPAQAKSSTEKN